LPAGNLRALIKDAGCIYTLKTELVHFFVDGYLDIEKDVPDDL
jgi:hypothetical protein